MATSVQLTDTPTELVAASVVVQNSSYRIQASKYNKADVIIWDTINPPGGGPSGYTLEPGQDIVIDVNEDVFYVWAFTPDPTRRFAEIIVINATS